LLSNIPSGEFTVTNPYGGNEVIQRITYTVEISREDHLASYAVLVLYCCLSVPKDDGVEMIDCTRFQCAFQMWYNCVKHLWGLNEIGVKWMFILFLRREMLSMSTGRSWYNSFDPACGEDLFRSHEDFMLAPPVEEGASRAIPWL